MKRSTQVLLVTVALVLGAGVVLGRLSTGVPAIAPPPPHKQPPWVAEMGLTSDQQKQMDAIWADTRKKMDENRAAMDRTRQELQQQRDDAVHKLLSPQQQLAYDKIMDDYHAKRSEMDKQRDVLIRSAEDRSRALLDENQKAKWDKITKEMRNHRGPHGPGGPDGHGPDGHGPDGRGPDGHGPDGHGFGGHGPDDHFSQPPGGPLAPMSTSAPVQ